MESTPGASLLRSDTKSEYVPLDEWLSHLSLPPITLFDVSARYFDTLRLENPACAQVRGLFGPELRKRFCTTGSDTCSDCEVVSACKYEHVFGADDNSRRSSSARRGVDGQETLRPYWIQGVPALGDFDVGDRIAARLVTIGLDDDTAQQAHLDFRSAMARLGMNPRDRSPVAPLLSASRGVRRRIAQDPAAAETWWIETYTPLSITPPKRLDHIPSCPDAPWLPVLLAAGVRRFTGLARHFGSAQNIPRIAFPPMHDISVVGGGVFGWAGSVISRKQNREYPVENGLVGGILLRGASMRTVGPFLSCLAQTSVGKATAKGFGHFIVEPVR